jgi:hypothetical protein
MHQHPFADPNAIRQLIQAQIERPGSDKRRQASVYQRFLIGLFCLYHMVQLICTTWYIKALEVNLKAQNITLLLVLGLSIWMIGTMYYAYYGPAMLETTSARYWTSFILSPILSAAFCIAILRWLRIPSADWASAILLLAIPGMFGEAVVLSHLATFMPRLHVSSGGKYGAFLFATYALVMVVAERVTLGAPK